MFEHISLINIYHKSKILNLLIRRSLSYNIAFNQPRRKARIVKNKYILYTQGLAVFLMFCNNTINVVKHTAYSIVRINNTMIKI